MSDDLLVRAIAWRNGPDTGLSSIALLSYLMGWQNDGTSPHHRYATPSDCSDFGRCYNMLQKLPELKERLHDARAMSLEWKNLIDCWPTLEDLYKKAGFGWSDDLYEALNTCNGWRCVDCDARVHTKTQGQPSRCAGGCKAPQTAPGPVKDDALRENLVAAYLLVDKDGKLVKTAVCSDCRGSGRVDCRCRRCEDEHQRDCETCEGSGKVRATGLLDKEPAAEEGETVIVAIVDRRNLSGPRIGFKDIAAAKRGLENVLRFSDEAL